MSYHVLHITTPNCALSVDNGLLFCRKKDSEDYNMIAIADIKAIVIATFGVVFTNNCIAKLLENNVVILHCNTQYQPVGWSLPQERIVRKKVFYNQIAQNESFENILWKKILKAKVLNQAHNLDLIGSDSSHLLELINRPLMNEANIAKQYWQKYFVEIGNSIKREHANAETFENGCLNYGYAVINTLIYRSIIVHGLIASLGIHHCGKYKSTPLVYDLVEPYRAFVDYYFYEFVKQDNEAYVKKDFKKWSVYLAEALKNYRLEIGGISYKILDTVDIYLEKIAEAYLNFDVTNVFTPDLSLQRFDKDTQRNRENEE